MTKRRVNHQQHRRIRQRQDRLHEQLGPEQRGTLVRYYGKEAVIEADEGQTYRCRLRQHLGTLAAGDRVTFQTQDARHGVIVAVLPRTTVVGRPDKQGQMKPVAANVEQMMVVIAPQPLWSLDLLDSYLVAGETLGIVPIIVLNKYDLLVRENEPQPLALYQGLGYQVLTVSSTTGYQLEQLGALLHDKTSVFVGQSGVGKSSLITHFVPDKTIRIGDLSAIQAGKHTTSGSALYHLPAGGSIIDSPGVREFRLWHMAPEAIAQGFVEFRPLLGRCRFSNCQHIHEPDCALQQAVLQGSIAVSRLASYRKMVR